MTGAEADPRARRPLIRRIGERLGILISPEEQAAIALESQRIAEDVRRYEDHRDQEIDALIHSGDPLARVEAVLGIVDIDPYPNEHIIFDPKHPWPGPYLPNQNSSGTQSNS